MSIRTHTFNGRRWKIDVDSTVDGYCDSPTILDDGQHVLYVDRRLTGRARLETIIHEAVHAENPKLPEHVVERTARSVARFVWRLGYRVVEST